MALLVARPTAVRVHATPHQQTKKFTAMIEMETPAHAAELLKEIRRQEKKEFTAFWAKDPDFTKMEMVSFNFYLAEKFQNSKNQSSSRTSRDISFLIPLAYAWH